MNAGEIRLAWDERTERKAKKALHQLVDRPSIKKYHIEGSRLRRFAWFRRMQELHFAHHRHTDCNFAVINFFWDRILGTYRRPVKKLSDSLPQKCDKGLSGVVRTVQVPVG